MPNRFSLKRTSIFTTLYSALPLNRIEFNEVDFLLWRELSQQMRTFVLAEVSLNATVVGMKCLKSELISSCMFYGRSFSFLINPKAISFSISFLTPSNASGSLFSLMTIFLFCISAVARFPFTDL